MDRFTTSGMFWLTLIALLLIFDAACWARWLPFCTFSEFLWALQRTYAWTRLALLAVFV
ncbi:MAG: hypothetical protein IRZ03_19355, partial [Acidobacterium ailaaui]|nr:hypothetical protein [Pseudacidobacterium ailaaui]